LLLKFRSYGIQNKTLHWISSWLMQRRQRVVIDGESSDWLPVKSGVPQGTVLGPLAFLIYINDISIDVSSSLRLFADDCLLYRIISSPDDCANLQNDLNKVYNWSCSWQMKFNVDKCVALKCCRSNSPIHADYYLDAHRLENVQQHTYLGVIFNNTMSFIPHIDSVVLKATKVLNFIKRNLCKCSTTSKLKAYISLVRPILEYANSSWDPYYNSHINVIEKVQRRAVCWILNDYSTYNSVSAMLHELNLPTLQQRRQRARLSLLYKSMHNLIQMPIPQYYIPYSSSSRIHHKHSYIHPGARTNAYMNSFFPRTIKEWNSLPASVVDSNDLTTFQYNLDSLLTNSYTFS